MLSSNHIIATWRILGGLVEIANLRMIVNK